MQMVCVSPAAPLPFPVSLCYAWYESSIRWVALLCSALPGQALLQDPTGLGHPTVGMTPAPCSQREEGFCNGVQGAEGDIYPQRSFPATPLFHFFPFHLSLLSRPHCEPCWMHGPGLKPQLSAKLWPHSLRRWPKVTVSIGGLAEATPAAQPQTPLHGGTLSHILPLEARGLAFPPKRLLRHMAPGSGRSWKKDLSLGGKTDKSFPDKIEVNQINK